MHWKKGIIKDILICHRVSNSMAEDISIMSFSGKVLHLNPLEVDLFLKKVQIFIKPFKHHLDLLMD
jgi:hypothetical protein